MNNLFQKLIYFISNILISKLKKYRSIIKIILNIHTLLYSGPGVVVPWPMCEAGILYYPCFRKSSISQSVRTSNWSDCFDTDPKKIKMYSTMSALSKTSTIIEIGWEFMILEPFEWVLRKRYCNFASHLRTS